MGPCPAKLTASRARARLQRIGRDCHAIYTRAWAKLWQKSVTLEDTVKKLIRHVGIEAHPALPAVRAAVAPNAVAAVDGLRDVQPLRWSSFTQLEAHSERLSTAAHLLVTVIGPRLQTDSARELIAALRGDTVSSSPLARSV